MKKLRKALSLFMAMSILCWGGVFFSCSSDSSGGDDAPATTKPKSNPETQEEDVLVSIKAELTGDMAEKDLKAGDKISASDVKVTAVYKSGKEDVLEADKYTVSPETLTAETTELTVALKDSELTAKISVTVSPAEEVESEVAEISAVLTDLEKTWTEGDSVSPSDFTVTALYENEQVGNLSADSYTVSPETLSRGENEITITYGSGENAKTAKVTISAATLPKILSVSIPETLTIEADADSSITATVATEGEPAPEVTYEWTVEGEAITYTETTGNVLSIKGNNNDVTSSKTVKVTVKATANGKEVSSGECVITVKQHGIEVKDEVTGVSIAAVESSEIAFNGEISLTANASTTGTVTVEYDWIVAGDTDSVEIEKNSNVIKITGKNADTKNKKTVTVKATAKGGETTTAVESEKITITIGEAPVVVTGVELVKAETVKAKYYVGDTLDVTGLSLKLTKNDGSEENVDVTKLMVSEFDSTTAGEKTITVTYNGNVAGSYTVTVFEDTVASISAVVSTNKLWFEGNTVSASDLSVTATYDSGKTADLTTSDYVVSSAALVAGENEITVTYGSGENAKTTKVTVTAVADTVKSITVELADSTKAWKEGDSVAASDFKVTAKYESGKSAVAETGISVDPTTLAKGTNEISVTYSGITEKVTINAAILPKILSVSIPASAHIDAEAETTITATVTTEGEPAPAISYTWNVTGDTDSVDVTKDGDKITLKGKNQSATAEKIVTVKVTAKDTLGNEKSAESTVTIGKHGVVVTGVELVKAENAATKYYVGDAIDLTGLSLKLSKNDGTTSDVPVSADMISGFDSSAAGEKTITVTYNGTVAGTFTVSVVADTVVSINAVKANSSKAWKEGDTVSASDFTVTATYESGKTETPTSGITVEPTTLLAGENSITVTYGGKSASVSITATALPRASFSVKNYLSDGDISLSKTETGLKVEGLESLTNASVKWSVNGAEKSVTADSATLAGLGITKRGQYAVSVVVIDGNNTKYTASASVTLSKSVQ